eukprot:scaffold17531_cov241-Isochrysis_galbana.AAC.1
MRRHKLRVVCRLRSLLELRRSRPRRRQPSAVGRCCPAGPGFVLRLHQGRAGEGARLEQRLVQQDVVDAAPAVGVAAVLVLVPTGEAPLRMGPQCGEGIDHAVLVDDRTQPGHLSMARRTHEGE